VISYKSGAFAAALFYFHILLTQKHRYSLLLYSVGVALHDTERQFQLKTFMQQAIINILQT
jgi:hypothetical protein